jgi:streptomycin 6-kinase
VLHRFDRLTAELDLDRERARAWTIAQTVAWTPAALADAAWHLEVARWLL